MNYEISQQIMKTNQKNVDSNRWKLKSNISKWTERNQESIILKNIVHIRYKVINKMARQEENKMRLSEIR